MFDQYLRNVALFFFLNKEERTANNMGFFFPFTFLALKNKIMPQLSANPALTCTSGVTGETVTQTLFLRDRVFELLLVKKIIYFFKS